MLLDTTIDIVVMKMKAIGKYIAKTFGYDEQRDMDRPGTSLARVSKRDMMKEETAGMAYMKHRLQRSNRLN